MFPHFQELLDNERTMLKHARRRCQDLERNIATMEEMVGVATAARTRPAEAPGNSIPGPKRHRQPRKPLILAEFQRLGGCLTLAEATAACGMTMPETKKYLNRSIERYPRHCPWKRVCESRDRFVLKDWSQVTATPPGWEKELEAMRFVDGVLEAPPILSGESPGGPEEPRTPAGPQWSNG